ncbi:MAG: response regulator [Dehalococcoidia bacterium]
MSSVMVVEDDRALRTLMNAILRTSGHRVIMAENAQTALDQLGGEEELILLDLGLPDLDGSTFLAEAVERGYRGKVIVVSGAFDGRELAHLMGAEGYLPKPFTPEQLEAAIAETLGSR